MCGQWESPLTPIPSKTPPGPNRQVENRPREVNMEAKHPKNPIGKSTFKQQTGIDFVVDRSWAPNSSKASAGREKLVNSPFILKKSRSFAKNPRNLQVLLVVCQKIQDQLFDFGHHQWQTRHR